MQLTASLLGGVVERAAWERAVAESGCAAREWLNSQRSGGTLVFARATDVWRCWITKGEVGRMMQLVVADQRSARDKVRAVVQNFRDQFDQHLYQADRALHGGAADRNPIIARARLALLERVQQASRFARYWLALLDAEPDLNDFRQQRIAALRVAVAKSIAEARDDLAKLGDPPFAAPARRIARRLLDEFAQLLEAGATPRSLRDMQGEPSLDRRLSADLLAAPDIRFDVAGMPIGDAPSPAILCDLAKCQPDWIEAARQRRQRRDFIGAALCLERARAEGVDTAAEESDLDEDRSKARGDLARRQDDLLRRLATATAEGRLPEADRLDHEADLRRVVAEKVEDVLAAESVYGKIETALAAAEAKARRQAEQRLDDIRDGFGAKRRDDVNRVQSLINRGQIEVANDYIERLENSEPLPNHETEACTWESCFQSFFPDFCDKAARQLHPRDLRDGDGIASLLARLRGAQTLPPLMRVLDGDNGLREDAIRLLETWERARQADSPEMAQSLQEVFTALRFSHVQVSGDPPRRIAATEAWFDLQTATIADREIVVIPQVGSAAAGRYRVLMLRDRLAPNEVLARVTSQADPVIVLFFRTMDSQFRRELAARSFAVAAKRTLVLDDTLVCFLAQYGGSGGRLKALFDCTLPFTAADPYITDGGLLPPEMFFGRARERDEVFQHQGTTSFLVYGGRQLGKTALLRRIAAENASAHGQRPSDIVVRCIDIRQIGRTPEAPITSITRVLSETLREAGVLKKPANRTTDFNKTVTAWLNDAAGSGRQRILLMLDEADAFLKNDARSEYKELQSLKTLMDDTGRRFKVVFAGLHDVQRSFRDPNTPLAHFGKATLIGPMLRGADLSEAMRLVRQPLETLGFTFADEDTITRILAHCNYYPSLIQLFCKRLLAYARRNWSNDPTRRLPYRIGIEDVERVYLREDVRQDIRAKLQITLNLDKRYNYLTLLIALLSSGDDAGLVCGFDVADLRDQALLDWKQGFAEDDSIESFRALLDEMVGLGVLRRVRSGAYALRNPNVLQLIGGSEEIGKLYRHACEERPEPQDGRELRRWIDEVQRDRLSPLTHSQETQLLAQANGVTVLAGLKVARLDGLDAALEAMWRGGGTGVDAGIERADDVWSPGGLRRKIQAEMNRSRTGLKLLVVGADQPWAPEWVKAAAEILEPKTSQRKFLQVVFVADAGLTWHWLGGYAEREAVLRSRLVHEMALQPWTASTLNAWIDQKGFSLGDPRQQQARLQASGGWGVVFSHLYREVGGGGSLAACDTFFNNLPEALPDSAALFEDVAEVGAVQPVLEALHVLDEAVTLEDLRGFVPEIPAERLTTIIRWGEFISLLRRTNEGIHLDPLYRRWRTAHGA